MRELVGGHPTLSTVVEALLRSRSALDVEFRKLDKAVSKAAAADQTVRRLTSAPGVGALIGLTYKTAVDDPTRPGSPRRTHSTRTSV